MLVNSTTLNQLQAAACWLGPLVPVTTRMIDHQQQRVSNLIRQITMVTASAIWLPCHKIKSTELITSSWWQAYEDTPTGTFPTNIMETFLCKTTLWFPFIPPFLTQTHTHTRLSDLFAHSRRGWKKVSVRASGDHSARWCARWGTWRLINVLKT